MFGPAPLNTITQKLSLCNSHLHLQLTSSRVLQPYLDLEGSLEAAGKEAAERSHDGGKGGESDAVDLEGIEPHCGLWRREGGVRPAFEHLFLQIIPLLYFDITHRLILVLM